ncbi:MAG TPA: Ig-like domain-containing protein, partial [Pyrinomonadaceae bacterium]|nr:Ig-like domain-containing protein [Pyrinomonadaceae bacterium]
MKTQTSLLALIAVALLISYNTSAQQANSGASTATVVKTVQVSVPVKEAEVGQQVQVTVVATDAAGKTVSEKPSTYFAGPFDIAAVDDDGKVKLFGTGQVTVGAIVGGVPALTTFVVKPPSINAIELTPMKTPLVVGDSMQINAVTRVLNGVPRTGVPISWTSDNASVATVDAGGVVTGVGPGKAVITAAAGSATTKIPISVIKSNLRSLSITAGAKSARAGDVVYFKATGDPAQEFSTRWSVSGSG